MKRFGRKKKRPLLVRNIYFYVEFANGHILEIPVQVENGSYRKRDQLIAKLRDRKGILTDKYQRRYDLQDMVHYEIFDEKSKSN